MTKALRISVIVLAIVLAAFVALVLAYMVTPPFFISFGQHYIGAPDIFSVSDFYRCDPNGADDCVLTRESLFAAVANDPHIANWWPVNGSFILPEEYD